MNRATTLRPHCLRALAAVAAIALLSSCGSGTSSSTPSLRVINAAFRAPANFDVLVNGNSAATNLAFGQATAFQDLGGTSVNVQFDTTGTTTVAYTASPALVGGVPYSVVAVEGSSALTAISVAQLTGTVASNQTRLSFVNASPGQASLDFYVTGPTDTLPAAATLGAVAYPGDGASVTPGSTTVTSGAYRIRAVATGDTTQAVVYDSGPVTLGAGADLLLLVVPASGSASAMALMAVTASSSVYAVADQRAPLRFGNFSPTLGVVDAFLDSGGAGNSSTTLAVSAIAYGGVSSYLNEMPGTYRASLAATGTTTEAIGAALVLPPARAQSVFAVGLGSPGAGSGLQLLTVSDDLTLPAAGMAKLRFLAYSPDLGPVDVVQLDTSGSTPVIVRRLAVNLAYTGATAYVSLAAGTYALAVVPAGANTPLMPASGLPISVAAGSLYSVVAAGCRYPASGVCLSTSTAFTLATVQDR